MNKYLTILFALCLCFLGSEALGQRGSSESGGRSSYSRPSPSRSQASRPSGGRSSYSRPSPSRSQASRPSGGRSSYSQPSPSRSQASRPTGGRSNYSRPIPSRPPMTSRPSGGSGSSMATDRPKYNPPTSPRPVQTKPPTSTRPKPQHPTASRPQNLPGRGNSGFTQADPPGNTTRPGSQLNNINTMSGTGRPNPGKQDVGQLPPNPNDGPAGQRIVTVCIFNGNGTGRTVSMTESRAQNLVASGAAMYGQCSGDISGISGNTMSGTPTSPGGPGGNPGGLGPVGTMSGTPSGNPGGNPGGGNPGGGHPGGGHPGGGHPGGGYNGGPGWSGGTGASCPPTGGGGGYIGGVYCPPPAVGYINSGVCVGVVSSGYWAYEGYWGNDYCTLSYPFVTNECWITDITPCGPDRRTVILSSPCGTYHWKIMERRVRRPGYWTGGWGCRRYVSGGWTWRVVHRERMYCDNTCGYHQQVMDTYNEY